MAMDDSPLLIRRVTRSRNAPLHAANTDSNATIRKISGSGRTMTKIPVKPMTTADQRRQPTCSPSIGPASAVMTSGPENDSAVTSAKGSSARLVTIKNCVVTRKPARMDRPP